MALISWVARDFYFEDLWRGLRIESPRSNLDSWAGCLQPDCPRKKWVLSSGCLQGTAMCRPRHIVGKKEKYILSLLSFPLSWRRLFKETVWRAPSKAQALPPKNGISLAWPWQMIFHLEPCGRKALWHKDLLWGVLSSWQYPYDFTGCDSLSC